MAANENTENGLLIGLTWARKGTYVIGLLVLFIRQVKSRCCLMDRNENFLHYMLEIEGREGQYAWYDHQLEIEHLPETKKAS